MTYHVSKLFLVTFSCFAANKVRESHLNDTQRQKNEEPGECCINVYHFHSIPVATKDGPAMIFSRISAACVIRNILWSNHNSRKVLSLLMTVCFSPRDDAHTSLLSLWRYKPTGSPVSENDSEGKKACFSVPVALKTCQHWYFQYICGCITRNGWIRRKRFITTLVSWDILRTTRTIFQNTRSSVFTMRTGTRSVFYGKQLSW